MNVMAERITSARIPFTFLPTIFTGDRLFPVGMKKKIGKMRRSVLGFRGDFLSQITD
jgi:hypothetical protein